LSSPGPFGKAASARGTWRLLPKRVRALMANPPAGKETCEQTWAAKEPQWAGG
jgi:hypothetical protein